MTLLVLLAHGSHDPRWQAPFLSFVEAVQEAVFGFPQNGDNQTDSITVALGFMEMASPRLEDVVVPWLEKNPNGQVKVLPLFMAAGGHLRTDVPAQIKTLQNRFPQGRMTLLDPIGEHPMVRQAMVVAAMGCLDLGKEDRF